MVERTAWTAAAWVALALGAGPAAAQQPWQQGVEYRVEARLNEAEEQLEGFARVRYRNNSPRIQTEFYFHLYLNAFRPNSAWATKDLEYGIRTFQDLGPDEHGFERIRSLLVEGDPVVPFYPHAPDSTIVGFYLPDPLEPGESTTIDVRWDARPSTVPRRQGRRGRQYDFAQWYPRVVVFDRGGWRTQPLYRAGEFYGEFATYDVTLEVRRDQVMGATGTPVDGDPGWEGAAVAGTGPVDYQREWYGSQGGPPCIERGGERICGAFPARSLQREEGLGHLGQEAAPGYKQVRWYAEDVHHFGWSTSPDYIFEAGSYEDVAIRVLYRPGDEESWGGGIAVRRTATALQWLDSIFGDYPYPQVTNLHRLEGGGTEFPMLIMDGTASQGLILHEVGHIYAHGILANNEWYEGWLDEGLSSFQTAWFNEVNGGGPGVWEGSKRRVLGLELRGATEPVVMNAEAYAEQSIYSAMIYTKGSLIFWMLREMVGEETFTRILRTYYERFKFQHVTSTAFQSVAEEVSGRDLDWFFGQWLHSTGVVDYGLDGVETFDSPNGTWVRFDLERKGPMRMPVPVRIEGGGNVKDTVVHGMDLERRVEIWTDFRPYRVTLDPEGRILDVDPRNDEWTRSWFDQHGIESYLDNPLRPARTALDHLPQGFFPAAWATGAGGWSLGLRTRTSLLGFSNTETVWGLPGLEIGDRGGRSEDRDWGSLYARMENPLGDRRAVMGTTSEVFGGEGRLALISEWARDLRRHPVSGREKRVHATFGVVRVYDDAYLPTSRWSSGTRSLVEGETGGRLGVGLGAMELVLGASGAFGFDTDNRRYFRGAVSADGVVGNGGGWQFATRFFAGYVAGYDPDRVADGLDPSFAPRERMFNPSSGDPLQQLGNPFVRSSGALLDQQGRTAGGGTLAGVRSTLSFPAMATLALELARAPWRLGSTLEVRPILFAGAGWVDDVALGSPGVDWLGSGGVGLEAGLASSPVRIRLDLPFWVSEPLLASSERTDEGAFRWEIRFSPPGWN